MPWWGYVIIAGCIFMLAVLVLIWIIVASNKIVVLKKSIDRNFPLINGKIKDFNKGICQFVLEIEKKNKSRSLDILKKANDTLAKTEGIFKKIEQQSVVNKKFETVVKFVNKNEELKKLRKLKKQIEELNEIQIAIEEVTKKYNDAVDKYNIVIARFPTRLVAERFKFEQAKKWEKK